MHDTVKKKLRELVFIELLRSQAFNFWCKALDFDCPLSVTFLVIASKTKVVDTHPVEVSLALGF